MGLPKDTFILNGKSGKNRSDLFVQRVVELRSSPPLSRAVELYLVIELPNFVRECHP